MQVVRLLDSDQAFEPNRGFEFLGVMTIEDFIEKRNVQPL